MSGKTGKVTWVDGLTFEAESGSGHKIILDGSVEGCGADKGARPTELVLEALAGCTAMDVVSILRKKKQPLEGLEVIATGHQNETYPHYFNTINVEYIAYGDDVDPEALARAVELSETKYCAVSATLAGVAKITTTSRVASARHKAHA